MDYHRWRDDVFGQPPGIGPGSVELLEETHAVQCREALDHIDRALIDPAIHDDFSKEQIGVGLNLIYSNCFSDYAFCYIDEGDESRTVLGIQNLRYLYDNFFQRYCTAPVENIGNEDSDGVMGYVCYMLWDIFVLYPGNITPKMVAAGLRVMEHAINSSNDNCVVSAIHGLGHWVDDAPPVAQILERWLRKPTSENMAVREYAKRATTGCIQ